MAGLGIGPDDFALFDIDDPDRRTEALQRRLQPKLEAVGRELAGGLSRVAGKELHPHCGLATARRDRAPGELFVAFSESPKGYRGQPYLALAVTRGQLHARVAARGTSARNAAMRRALERETQNLARKGKPFRKLRLYLGWDHEDLPEVAPAHSPAFWQEVADDLAPSARNPGVDLGLAWTSEEARSLAIGDVLGAFRDLAPLFKLLANAR